MTQIWWVPAWQPPSEEDALGFWSVFLGFWSSSWWWRCREVAWGQSLGRRGPRGLDSGRSIWRDGFLDGGVAWAAFDHPAKDPDDRIVGPVQRHPRAPLWWRTSCSHQRHLEKGRRCHCRPQTLKCSKNRTYKQMNFYRQNLYTRAGEIPEKIRNTLSKWSLYLVMAMQSNKSENKSWQLVSVWISFLRRTTTV